jgi:moderate conductance mechanosensitive channel
VSVLSAFPTLSTLALASQPSVPGDPTPSNDSVTRQANLIGDWFKRNGHVIVSDAVSIVLVILMALVIRKVTLTFINRAVEKAAARAATKPGRLLEGSLLMGAERRHQRTRALGSVLRSVASAAILIIAALMVIDILHIPTGPILASVGVLSAAIGFGARDMVTDLLSGVFMILEDQYGVGDYIDAGDAKGTVEDVALRVTQLRDIDGVVWYIRNGTVKRIGNLSQGHSRAVVDIPVAYTADTTRVRELMIETANELFADMQWKDRFLDEAPTIAGIESIAGDRLMMRVSVRTAPQKSAEVARELRLRLKTAFDVAGVGVAATPA